ncbi:hypothetical protein [Hahella sp. CCB-MM4]|uniref:hypothetical protein n=1 Tax=Hahella sp. (strain CCB-MM4) TaxID=1926491 RepID=UPI00143DE143|nr:hypothetical protein [Hahella sp. CCB-MM4]
MSVAGVSMSAAGVSMSAADTGINAGMNAGKTNRHSRAGVKAGRNIHQEITD